MIDIDSRKEGLAGRYSNFFPRYFIFDGVECLCLEGPLQAFKYDNPEIQRKICKLTGREAELQGQKRNLEWQYDQMLWWMGEKFPRGSEEYWQLVKRLFRAAFSDERSKNELLASESEILIHSIGGKDQTKTVLTESEFCFLLMLIREELRY